MCDNFMSMISFYNKSNYCISPTVTCTREQEEQKGPDTPLSLVKWLNRGV